MIQVLGELMEDFCLIHWVCCNTCYRQCATRPELVLFRDSAGRLFCSEAHLLVHTEYLRLCREATEKAKNYPKREIDLSGAHAYWVRVRSEFP